MIARILIAGALVLSGSILRADTIFNNFGAGDTYDLTVGLPAGTEYDHSFAISFTSEFYYQITGIRVAVSRSGSAADEVTIGIYTDNAGLPDLLLGSFDMGSPIGEFGVDGTILSLYTSSGPRLEEGGNYWIVMNTEASQDEPADLLWNLSTQNIAGTVRAKDINGNWLPAAQTEGSPLGAFSIDGQIVPEPSTVLMIAGGLGALLLRRRR